MDYEAVAKKIMQKADHEIEDFNYNTWHVTNWQNLEKRITGPEFNVGGWKWRILLFPFGKDGSNKDFVSIYLDFADIKSAPPGWHLCVQFALALWSPEDTTQYISYHACHRFTAEEQDWGFTRFYTLQRLLTPCESRTRALIENGTTNITAFVRVLKDPTGFLWHNFNRYDSKKETGYVGLVNRGHTSYMNALLQLLYCITYFRKAIYRIPTDGDQPKECILSALQRTFYNLQTSDMTVGTMELLNSFRWCSDSQDLQEFNRLLRDELEAKMEGTGADGTYIKLFAGKIKKYIKCMNVDYVSSHVEDYYDIQLNVKGCTTLRDSLKNYIQEEILEGDNKYYVEGYGSQDFKKGVIFESFPPVLQLQLKRFEYSATKDKIVKVNSRFKYPMEIDLEEFLSKDVDKSNSYKYFLHGVFVRSGMDINKGHYFILIKPKKDDKWFKFDDNRVTPATDKEVLDDNYSCHGIRLTNAYKLVYICESNVNEILSPVVVEDIPYHLRRMYLEEEMITKEQKKEEIKENLTIKVVNTKKIKNYQGFDLANFNEAHTYKIHKSEKYGVFKKNISQTFNILPEHVRFWVLVNRRNKTIRPDSPISESYFNIGMDEVHKKMTSNQNEMKLYMEVADKPINGKIWFPEGNDHIMVFLKYFDPDKQAFEGLGHLYIQKLSKVSDYAHVFCEKKELPSGILLEIYEEINPNVIEKMNPEFSFQQLDVQNGDIICFQKVLSNKEIQEHKIAGRCWNIPDFYKSLITVSFKPKFKNKEPRLKFNLVFGKKCMFNMVAEAVATNLNSDPPKLRLTSAFSASGVPKSIVKKTTTGTLSEMLRTPYLKSSAHVLFYEILDINVVELETKKFFKVYWLGNMVKEEFQEDIDIHLQENTIISELIEEILKKVTLSSPDSIIRLFQVHHNRIQNEFKGDEPIGSIQELTTLYAEEVPLDEISINQNDQIIQVCHFKNDPTLLHGIPFKFVIKYGEKLIDTKTRLQQRLGMSEKDFSKVKISIIPGTLHAKPEYLYDDDVILSEMNLSKENYLGLDHVDKWVKLGVQELFNLKLSQM
ncbi:hypothetical protein RclHR1_01630014 [Rhizophagus clarus]|uniref:ubiquitinyl hydrolase 1 n=1 Tax=Rhizophagus clarus TaxID=94130 RepID=A0A2Z6RA30_9GLOM|nr:hypothetical protein RclHR1_01630014 [Rhizophagus clarus]